jgi:hypothetical protein
VNLYFLVEGDRTEPRVYREWLRHQFPELIQVGTLAQVTSNCYILFRGNGYPSYLKRIGRALADIRDRPLIDHFFVCIDSEERSYADRFEEVRKVVEDIATKTGMRTHHPRLQSHIIVQHCCVETWFLGHTKMLRRNPESARLIEMKEFYNVSVDDPEGMGRPPGYLTRASFHLAYLQEMLREQGKMYTKTNPGVVLERNYLDALQHRCSTTGHLPSLQKLFTTWSAITPSSSAQ